MKALLSFVMLSVIFSLLMGKEFWELGAQSVFGYQGFKDVRFILGVSSVHLLVVAWLLACFASITFDYIKLFGLPFYSAFQSTNRLIGSLDLPLFFLIGFVGWSLVSYATSYEVIAAKTDFVVLLAGVTSGQMLRLYLLRRHEPNDIIKVSITILASLSFVLGLASITHPQKTEHYFYHDQLRWTGPWNGPNTFGLLMGVGVILTSGLGLLVLKVVQRHGLKSMQTAFLVHLKYAALLVGLSVGAASMSYGLVRSFSRGAWLATMIAALYLTYFACFMPGKSREGLLRFRKRCLEFLLVGGLLAIPLIMISRSQANKLLLQRILSMSNKNDFSGKNRLFAYKGSLLMISDKPLFGFGWNRTDFVFESYYKPMTMTEGKAIILNDFFTLATSSGLPSLILFTGYVYLKMQTVRKLRWNGTSFLVEDNRARPQRHMGGLHKLQTSDFEWIKITCRAAMLVLLVGFWFETGLFLLALSIPFWILLEIGGFERVEIRPGDFEKV